MRPDAFGQFELKLRRSARLAKDRIAREQRSGPAVRGARQGSRFEELGRWRLDAECREPAAKVDVDLDASPVVLDEYPPALLWTNCACPRTRLLNKEGHFDTSRIQQTQICERSLRSIESFWRQRDPNQARRPHVQALA